MLNGDRAWVPQLVHAIAMGGVAAGAFLVTHNEVAAAAIVIGASRIIGELVDRTVPPKRKGLVLRKRGPLTEEEVTRMRKQLEAMRRQVADEVQRQVNRLAVWRAEFDLSVDDALSRLPEPNQPPEAIP